MAVERSSGGGDRKKRALQKAAQRKMEDRKVDTSKLAPPAVYKGKGFVLRRELANEKVKIKRRFRPDKTYKVTRRLSGGEGSYWT